MIAEAVRAYIRFYLNFRSQQSLVQLEPWSLEKDVIQDGGLDVSFGLSFNASSKLSLAAVIKIANEELNSLLPEEQAEDLSAVVSSFLHTFYLPAQGYASINNFIHYKAIAFFQLSLNVPQKPRNSKARLAYIRLLLDQAFLYDRIQAFEFQEGQLHYAGQSLAARFDYLMRESRSDVFCETIRFCQGFLDFIEKGMEEEEWKELLDLVDDCYAAGSHYGHFLGSSPYKYKRLLSQVEEMYDYPKDFKAAFVNRMYLLNFYYLAEKPQECFDKYIKNKVILRQVSEDFQHYLPGSAGKGE